MTVVRTSKIMPTMLKMLPDKLDSLDSELEVWLVYHGHDRVARRVQKVLLEIQCEALVHQVDQVHEAHAPHEASEQVQRPDQLQRVVVLWLALTWDVADVSARLRHRPRAPLDVHASALQ